MFAVLCLKHYAMNSGTNSLNNIQFQLNIDVPTKANGIHVLYYINELLNKEIFSNPT